MRFQVLKKGVAIALMATILCASPRSSEAFTCHASAAAVKIIAAITAAKATTIAAIMAAEAALAAAIGAQTVALTYVLETTSSDITTAIAATTEQQTRQINANFEFLVAELRKLLIGHALTVERNRLTEIYGPAGTAPSLGVDCGGVEKGTTLRVARGVEEETARTLYGAMQQYSVGFTSPESFRRYVGAIPETDLTALSLAPRGGTYTEVGMKKARAVLELMTNPSPEANLTTAQEQTIDGQRYEALRKVKRVALVPAQKAASDYFAHHAPIADENLVALANTLHQQAGGSGTAPAVVENKISMAGLIDTMVDARFASPEWEARMAEKVEKGLLTEIAMIKALELELDRRILRCLENIMLLSAELTARGVATAFDSQFESLRNSMLAGSR